MGIIGNLRVSIDFFFTGDARLGTGLLNMKIAKEKVQAFEYNRE